MVKQTAGRDALGTFAPIFAALNDDVLFGEVWSREDKLSLKLRSIVTVTALVSKGMVDASFEYHLKTAKANGVTREEMAEILTHLAFYAGWPNAWAAFNRAVAVYADDDAAAADAEAAAADAAVRGAAGDVGSVPGGDGASGASASAAAAPFAPMFGLGNPNDAYAAYFSGASFLNPLTSPATQGIGLANVSFEPGCRNNWHVHHAKTGGGQMLVCTDGRGWYQEWGKPAQELTPGSVVYIPAGVKHWHGAAADSWFAHVAFEVPGEGCSNEWLEPVSDEQYAAL